MRLSNATLGRVRPDVAAPAYSRASIGTGIVHLGIGAFHRAHQAVYTDAILGKDPSWGIAGISLRSPDTRDALAPQDGLYTVSAMDGAGAGRRVIGASTALLVAPEDPAAVVRLLAMPATRIVTLTVTEKGYHHDPATGALRENDPGIEHDLKHPHAPRTALGFLVAGLKARREAGQAPFTILSCDNLPVNGETVGGLVKTFANKLDADLGAYIDGEVRFPSSMVDRIVPATTDQDRQSVGAALGLEDAWPIMTEPFSQWVVEDRFSLGRPAWDEAGVQFVSDVKPYELMKLRLLNAAHSTLSYLGYLMGHETVAAAMAEPALARLVRDLMYLEAGPTLPFLPGFDLDTYREDLLTRFKNPALKHRTWQIAMDGSQKLPQRLLGIARDRLAKGLPIPRIALGVAAWMRYVTGLDESGGPIDVRDPLAAKLKDICATAGLNAERLAPALLGLKEIFGADLATDPRFRGPVEQALDDLIKNGSLRTVAAANRQ
jgi:fructuronate reductase